MGMRHIVICGRNGHAPYCQLWSQWACAILSSVVAMGMRHIVMCGRPASVYFSTLSQDFREKILNSKCEFWFSLQMFCLKTILILMKSPPTNRHTFTSVYMWNARYSCQILMTLEFSRKIFDQKTLQISNLIKIFPMLAALFHADGQTDWHDEANSRFSQFCESA